MQHEIELKLQAAPETLRALGNSARVREISSGKSRTCRLVSTYFDTPRHTLRKSGISLRVRQALNRFEQTVKVPVPGPLALQTCREWNGAVPDAKPHIKAIDDREIRSQLEYGRRDRRLAPVFTTDATRKAVPIKHGKSTIELSVDVGTITTPKGPFEAISELELELQSGDVSDLLDFALELCESHNLTLGHLTKAQRGYFLAQPNLREAFHKAEKVELTAVMSVAEAFDAIMVSGLNHLRSNETSVAEGHPDGVHQARVAIRRMRAALWAFRRVLPGKERNQFNREFRWFQTQLSPARDWHVFIDETIPAIQSSHPELTASQVRKLARGARKRALINISSLFETTRYASLILNFSHWLSTWQPLFDPALEDISITRFASAVLDRSHAALMDDTRPLSRMSVKQRHRLRKRAKKTRYACEFFAALWPGPRTDHYLETMKQFQDALGVINDASVASQLIAPGDSMPLSDRSCSVVSEWSTSSARQHCKSIQPKWRKFQRLEPFWRVEAAGQGTGSG